MLGGATCILGSFLFARKLPLLRGMLRPIYVRMGIVSDSVPGIQGETD
jgi:hypothetical protein